MSINSILTRFSQRDLVLSRNDYERGKIEASLSRLEDILEDKLDDCIDEFIRFGSFTRNTILPRQYDPQSDIDLLVVFNKQEYNYSPATYHKWILQEISKAYPNSIYRKDHPVIKLELNHIMFDIVPAYSTHDFWNGTRYFIPAGANQWKQTFPNDINAKLADKNQSYGDNIVRNVIRLCKHWNAMSGYPFQSYLMEKKIVETFLWHGDDLYTKFISVLGDIAGRSSHVNYAINGINNNKGSWFSSPDENKQLQYLKRLLPGLK